jgi:hypothetical protein
MRLVNRPLAVLLAAFLAVAGVLLIIEVIAVAVNATPAVIHWTTWHHWANKTRWNARVVRFWSIVLIIAGLVLLALELKPSRVNRSRMASEGDATDAAMTRRGLAGALRAAATEVDGIRRADVKVKRRRALIAATAAAKDRDTAQALVGPVRESVDSRLQTLDLAHPPRVRIRVSPRSK